MKISIYFLTIILFTLLSCEKIYVSDKHMKFGKEGGCKEVIIKARLVSNERDATLTCTEPYIVEKKYLPGGDIIEVWGGPDTCIYKYQWIEVHQYFDKPLKVFVEENKTGKKRELKFCITSGDLHDFIKVTQKGK